MLRMVDRLSDLCAKVAGWLFFAIGWMITYEVIARYGFTAPTIWAEEMSRFLQIWAVYLGAAHVLRHGQLIRITVLIDWLGARGRWGAEAFSLVVIIAFGGIAAWWGTLITMESLEIGRTTTTMLRVPLWLSEIAIPLGATLLLLQALAQLVRLVRDGNSGAWTSSSEP